MFNYLIHFNEYINYFINILGLWFYVLLFFITFCETGIILGIFFPGDSLLFTIGITSSTTNLNIYMAILSICLGAIIGDSCNYITGKFVSKTLKNNNIKIFNKPYLFKTKKFLEKYGTKAMIFSRFIAFARTITPFIMGINKMNYIKFLILGIISAIIWSFSITYTAYYFSKNKFIKQNLNLLITIVIIITIVQILIKIILHIIKNKKINI